MKPFWIRSGLALLEVDGHGGLHASDAFLGAYLQRAELAPIDIISSLVFNNLCFHIIQ